MIGRTISQYWVLEKTGQGGMDVVYRAEDTRLKRTVVFPSCPRESALENGVASRTCRIPLG
jgi:hypothetical protein